MQEQLRDMILRQIAYNNSIELDWHERDFSCRSAVWVEGAKIAGNIINADAGDECSDKAWELQLIVVSVIRLLIRWVYVEEHGDVDRVLARIQTGLLRPAMSAANPLYVIECFCAHVLVNDMPSIPLFRSVMDATGLKFIDLYERFIGVDTLNKFRVDNSFRVGGYTRIWKGREDIFHLKDVIENLGFVSPDLNLSDVIYRKLDNCYRSSVLVTGEAL